MTWTDGLVTFLLLICITGHADCYNVVRKDPFASLSETLVTHQRAACDEDVLQLQCPSGTLWISADSTNL